jgi:hypothetical protein
MPACLRLLSDTSAGYMRQVCQVCHDTRVHNQPTRPATNLGPGSRFHLDFGSSKTNRHTEGKDCIVPSLDGYNVYYLITNACSRYN